jgi:hypothetical protein
LRSVSLNPVKAFISGSCGPETPSPKIRLQV